MTPEARAVAFLAKGVSRRSRRQWTAWDHDRELVVRHAAQVRARWAEQWPGGKTIAEGWRAFQGVTKATQAQRQAEATLAAGWLYQHLKPYDRTLAALVAAIEEAYALGRSSALKAIESAGIATPLGSQALDALTAASMAGRLHDLTSRLAAAEQRQLRRLARALADDANGTGNVDDLAAAIDGILGDGAWVDVLTSTEAQTALIAAADSVYLWAQVEFKEFITAGDQLVCVECEDSEQLGPIPYGSEFTYGDPPIHPNCRCGVFPLSAADLGVVGAQDVLAGEGLSLSDLVSP